MSSPVLMSCDSPVSSPPRSPSLSSVADPPSLAASSAAALAALGQPALDVPRPTSADMRPFDPTRDAFWQDHLGSTDVDLLNRRSCPPPAATFPTDSIPSSLSMPLNDFDKDDIRDTCQPADGRTNLAARPATPPRSATTSIVQSTPPYTVSSDLIPAPLPCPRAPSATSVRPFGILRRDDGPLDPETRTSMEARWEFLRGR